MLRCRPLLPPVVLVVAEPAEYLSGAVGLYPVLPRRFLLAANVAPAQGDHVGRSRPCTKHERMLSIGSALLQAYRCQSKTRLFRRGTVSIDGPPCGRSSSLLGVVGAKVPLLPSNKFLPPLATTTRLPEWVRAESAVLVKEAEESRPRVGPKNTREMSSLRPRDNYYYL